MQEKLWFVCDETLSVPDHINAKISNAHKGIGIIKNPQIAFRETPF